MIDSDSYIVEDHKGILEKRLLINQTVTSPGGSNNTSIVLPTSNNTSVLGANFGGKAMENLVDAIDVKTKDVKVDTKKA